MKQSKRVAEPDATGEDAKVQERLERLRAEYARLNEQRIATDRDRKNLEEQLQGLRHKAEQEYGTSDIGELRHLLEKRRKENEEMVSQYEDHIREIKEKLEAIENPESREG